MRALLGAVLIGLYAFAFSTSARAGLVLTLNDGVSSQTVSDTDGNGQVTFIGSLGSFFLNLTGGHSAQTATEAILNLLSFNASSTRAGKITITLTDDSFSGPIGDNVPVTSIFNASAGVSIDYASYIDGVLIGSVAGARGGDSYVFTDYAATKNPYTLTQVATITHLGKGLIEISSFDATTIVSEPSVLATLILGIAGIGFMVRHRRSKTATS